MLRHPEAGEIPRSGFFRARERVSRSFGGFPRGRDVSGARMRPPPHGAQLPGGFAGSRTFASGSGDSYSTRNSAERQLRRSLAQAFQAICRTFFIQV